MLVIGHSATRYALDQLLASVDPASTLAEPGAWRPGWEYECQHDRPSAF
ncbi:MAG: hypothetical protein QOD89_3047 [Bradyrhizobium sp.]|nr:hypothetical protein [Bradyrhizobium sp.]